jgi:hypothetical protein
MRAGDRIGEIRARDQTIAPREPCGRTRWAGGGGLGRFQHCQTTNGVFVLAETAWSGSSWVAQVPGKSPTAPRQGLPVLTNRDEWCRPDATDVSVLPARLAGGFCSTRDPLESR